MEWQIQEKQIDGEWLMICVAASEEIADRVTSSLNRRNGHGKYRFVKIESKKEGVPNGEKDAHCLFVR